ncbi:FxsA family protein [Phytohalomonas tamaricis]|uniref:FxsA family protein n=1 Tax=Phytohalomonas tamaricis TaxID=2081032 RepID=UPI000D0B48CE|nr:FxsA family protein [Phytohalomonas tamaricis]
MPILFIFALFMLLDFASLFALGHHLGFFSTLGIMLLTAALGVHLIRREGFATLRHAQARFLQGDPNANELMQGTLYIVAGLLLLAPGTLTDILGLLCLLPISRDLLMRQLERRNSKMRNSPRQTGGMGSADFTSHTKENTSRQHSDSNAPIEGEYIERKDDKK